MPFFLYTQVVLPYASAVPGDVAINTFSFVSLDETPDAEAAITDINAALGAFYGDISAYYPEYVIFGNARARWYGGADANSAVFLEEDPLDVDPDSAGGTPLPAEVAICLSFAGESALGGAPTTPQNRRGRIYLGPLNTTVVDDSELPGYPRVEVSVRNAIRDAAVTFHTAVDATVFEWIVLSRSTGGSMTPITHGWVDNEFDTQRRRGFEATDRTLISF